MKNTFVFHKSWADAIKGLPKDIRLEVYEAIIEYGLTGTERDLKPMVKLAFGFVKTKIDEDREKQDKRADQSRVNGSKGGNPNFKKGQKNPYYNKSKKITQDNPTLPNITQDNPIYNKSYLHNSNNNSNTKLNNFSLAQITDLAGALKNFDGQKEHLFIAYRFWELWHKANPSNKTLINANANAWSDEVRKILNLDKTSLERLIGIYTYFSECVKGTTGFRTFWFKTIKSIAGLRKKNQHGEYYIDRIIDEVNEQILQNSEFEKLVFSNIEKFKHYASTKH